MTNREAVEWIKAVRATDAKSSNQVGLLQRKEAFNMAIKALEEQEQQNERNIPKKPIEIDTDMCECPICRDLVYDKDTDYQCMYCISCGQKLDWSEKECKE